MLRQGERELAAAVAAAFVVRAFVKLRELLTSIRELARKLDELEPSLT